MSPRSPRSGASKGKIADAGDLVEAKARKRYYRRARRSTRPYAYWWTRPHYRPYYYYYWQHYYPYGGPLFY